MKIIVSHVYSNDNKGDAALLSVLLSDIRRVFNSPEITILTLDKIEKDEKFENVPVKNGFMYFARERYHNSLLRPIYAVSVAISTLLWAFIYRNTGKHFPLPKELRDTAMLYREADLIIPVGGGYIRSKAGLMPTITLFFIIHPLLVSYVLGKPTINYTQSVGPFGNKFQAWMAKFAIKRITGIIVRENISLQLLHEWGIEKNVFSSVDSGFAFTGGREKELRRSLGISSRQLMVGVTVRDWLKHEGQRNYEKTIAKLCDYVIKNYNAFIVFIPQVTVEHHHDDDRESGQRIYASMEYKNDAHVLIERYDHQTIKAVYGELDYLIGTRFHSVIFALTSYVPAIAIEYEHKTRGIMTELGLEDWVVDIRNIQRDQLTDLFDKLVSNREDYISQLKKTLPLYIEQADRSINFVKEIYEKNLMEIYMKHL